MIVLKHAFQTLLWLTVVISHIGMHLSVHAEILGEGSQTNCEHCACEGGSCCLEADDRQETEPLSLPTASTQILKCSATAVCGNLQTWLNRCDTVRTVILSPSLLSYGPSRPAYQRFCSYLI